MALNEMIGFGVSLPARSPDPIDMQEVRLTAQRAEALGFRDLWVSDNVLDHAFSINAMVLLAYAAALTNSIRLGVSVVVLPLHSPIHVAHQIASLDYVSSGRVILGVGLGLTEHYAHFQVPSERRVRRFLEGIKLMKALWTEPEADYNGDVYRLQGATMGLKPVQKPHPPIWMGGTHPNAVRRAALVADGWMGAGGQSTASFKESVPLLREALEKAGRDQGAFSISKRVIMSVHENPDVARNEVRHWLGEVYRNPDLTDALGVYGTPEQVKERIEDLVAAGATHLLLNPIARHAEQTEALAAIVGLS